MNFWLPGGKGGQGRDWELGIEHSEKKGKNRLFPNRVTFWGNGGWDFNIVISGEGSRTQRSDGLPSHSPAFTWPPLDTFILIASGFESQDFFLTRGPECLMLLHDRLPLLYYCCHSNEGPGKGFFVESSSDFFLLDCVSMCVYSSWYTKQTSSPLSEFKHQ